MHCSWTNLPVYLKSSSIPYSNPAILCQSAHYVWLPGSHEVDIMHGLKRPPCVNNGNCRIMLTLIWSLIGCMVTLKEFEASIWHGFIWIHRSSWIWRRSADSLTSIIYPARSARLIHSVEWQKPWKHAMSEATCCTENLKPTVHGWSCWPKSPICLIPGHSPICQPYWMPSQINTRLFVQSIALSGFCAQCHRNSHPGSWSITSCENDRTRWSGMSLYKP